jgi:hypothetical protein
MKTKEIEFIPCSENFRKELLKILKSNNEDESKIESGGIKNPHTKKTNKEKRMLIRAEAKIPGGQITIFEDYPNSFDSWISTGKGIKDIGNRMQGPFKEVLSHVESIWEKICKEESFKRIVKFRYSALVWELSYLEYKENK